MTESKTNKSSVVEILEARISAILKNIEANKMLDISSTSLASMTDSELLSALFDMHANTANNNPKLIKMLKRTNKGKKKFLDYISKNGGWCSQSEYAEILGVSRQTINNRITQNSLLAIEVNGKKQVPLFQIDENTATEVEGLSRINKILLERQEVGVAMACTFWLSSCNFKGFHQRRRDHIINHENSAQAANEVANDACTVGEMGR